MRILNEKESVRKRKTSGSSCLSSHSTVSGSCTVVTEDNDHEMQPFMLEEYSMDTAQKISPCLVYLPIKRQHANEENDSSFEVKIKIRSLTKDEQENSKLKQLKQHSEVISNETSKITEIAADKEAVVNAVEMNNLEKSDV